MITKSIGYGWRVAVAADKSVSAACAKTPTDRGGYSYNRATIVAFPANRGATSRARLTEIRKAGAEAIALGGRHLF